MLLIVDDSAFSRKATRLILERLGYEVEEAKDVPQALELIASREYQCVLTDLLMPGLTGMDLLERVRAISRVPVAVISCDVQQTTRDRCLKLGALSVVHKPVDETKLSQLLSLVLAPR
ncbi:response regulator [bacterium]|nr:response regulator [bacterium]